METWRDPLATPGDQLPLGPPPEHWTGRHEQPSQVGTRPYSLRGAVPAAKSDLPPGTVYSYDPARQVTTVRNVDGTDVPLSRHTKPGPTPGGTSESRDGGGEENLPGEEMLPPDYQED